MIHYHKLASIDNDFIVAFVDKEKQEYSKEVISQGAYKALKKDIHYLRFSHIEAIECMMQFKQVETVNTLP